MAAKPRQTRRGRRETAGITQRLAECIVRSGYEDIPEDTVVLAKECVLDHVANLLAGSTQDLGKITIRYLKEMGGAPLCSVAGSGLKSSPTNAAFAHGTFARSMDYDNTWFTQGGHPVAPTLPPVLALGEMHSLPGKRLIEAFLVGLEVKARLHLAANTAHADRSFHGRGLMGEMGAAAAGAKLLGLDMDRTRMALGLAAARAGGIDSTGTMSNPADTGLAARSGTEAALLASMGYTANPNAIEAENGFRQFMGEDADLELVVKGFASPWHLAKRGIAFKRYPCQYPTHRHIDAILGLRKEHGFTYEDVEFVEVTIAPSPGHTNFDIRSINNHSPASGLDGKFSVPYTAAAALLDGKVVIDTFTDEKRFSPEMEAALKKVRVRVGEQAASAEEMWSRATIHLKGGRVLEKTVHRPHGIWGDRLSREERLAKFTDCARRVLATPDQQRLVELVEGLEDLPNIAELMAILRKRPRG
ncbi:MAG: MmgE/PrpD family protein [Chloroflexi bacterium]|nr:MmgE/PrpD family protein [Chloroflexota bacterium]